MIYILPKSVPWWVKYKNVVCDHIFYRHYTYTTYLLCGHVFFTQVEFLGVYHDIFTDWFLHLVIENHVMKIESDVIYAYIYTFIFALEALFTRAALRK